MYILTVSVVDNDTSSIGTINSYTKTILNYRVELGNDVKNVGSVISVYKTKLINLEGEWVIGAAEEGTAEVVDYAKFYQGKVSGGESTSIDYGSFVANPTPVE